MIKGRCKVLKIFKLAKAELKKMFLKPIMLFVFLAIGATITLLAVTFQPEKRVETVVNVNKTQQVQTIYDDFLNEALPNSKKSIDDELLSQANEIVDFLNNFKTDESGHIYQLERKISSTKNAINDIHSSISEYNRLQNDSNATNTDIAAARGVVVNKFNEVANKAQDTRSFFQTAQSSLNFFITEDDAETFLLFFVNLQSSVPNNFPNTANDQFLLFETSYNFLNDEFNFAVPTKIAESLEYFKITEESFEPILTKHFYDVLDVSNTTNTQPALNSIFAQITEFNNLNADSEETEHLDKMEQLISQYKSTALMNAFVLENEFLLAKAGNKNDGEIRKYKGFADFNAYQIRQNASINTYMLDNDLFDFNFLNTFSFNQNSGQTTNAFDFVVYAMQILTMVIAIFAIFVASSTIASEQNTGTMKMLAIRPYSRTKIITAKLISVINFVIIALIVSFVSTFIVGYVAYGINQTATLVVFNSSNVFVLNSFVVLAIYFLTLFLKLAFFAVISLLFSMLFKSNTVAIILSVLIYGFSLIGNALLIHQAWFATLPIAHLDVFRFFGSGGNASGFFGFSYPLNSNFYVSLVYLTATMFLSYLISTKIFKTRNIA